MIQLLVNRFNEPEETIRPLLDSIAGQQGAPEFSAIIGDDGSDVPLSDEFLSRYPFVRYEMLPHRGMSATRNALMDMANGEYVCFLDSDDLYVSLIGLHVISRHFPFDTFASPFLEERREGASLLGYVSRENDPFFLHGKCFRLGFLRDNDIRWDDSMERYGDPVFLWQAICLAGKVVYCNTPFYLWRYNPSSLCRSETGHFYATYHESVHEFGSLVRRFLDRGRRDLASRFATLMVYDAYFMTDSDRWEEHGSPTALPLLAEYVRDYADLISVRPDLYREKQGNFRREGPEAGIEGVMPWLETIEHMSHNPL